MASQQKSFKQAYEEAGPEDLQAQLPYLEEIYNRYLDRARDSNHWLPYLKVRWTHNNSVSHYSVIQADIN